MKKLLSMLLILCMLIPSNAGMLLALDNDTEEINETTAMAEWEAGLGEYTETPANAYTPVEPKNMLNAVDTGHAYEPEFEKEEEKTISADEYVQGEVLFSRVEGGFSLFGDDDIEDELSSLGISDISKVTSIANETSGFSLFGSTETVWYQAKTSGDVLETVDALNELDGIKDAQPNLIYTTEAIGEPSETEIANQWYLGNGETGTQAYRDPYGLHDGWYKHWYHDNWNQGQTEPTEEEQQVEAAPGSGAIVAVIDTGVDYKHEDLASNIWINKKELEGLPNYDDDGNGYIDDIYGVDVTASVKTDGNTVEAGDPSDVNGHGTHVAGIIAMEDNDIGGVGIAYGAKIMVIKAGQSNGSFTSRDIYEAIQYARVNHADVINMSFGGTNKDQLVMTTLEDAAKECVLVAAAGNDSCTTTDAPDKFPKADIYPAAYNFVIGVMASDESDNKADFSNWDYYANVNAEYEIIAPGTQIYSTIPGGKYANLSGTSMATPMVAASAAIIRSYFPDKEVYNSKYIMGQLVSASNEYVSYTDELNEVHNYSKLNLYDSLNNSPEPKITFNEIFALDNDEYLNNDGDGVIDAGETVELGITLRNQWGKASNVKITANVDTGNGVQTSNFITFDTDEITLADIGTFSSADNGLKMQDGRLVSIENPIKFTIKPNTNNDAQFKINLVATYYNAYDLSQSYTETSSFTFRVLKGKKVSGSISTDTTWTKDDYYIIENSIIVKPGVTLTVASGTQIQFWSQDPQDAYASKPIAQILNYGVLNMLGTSEAPIDIFPGGEFENYACIIGGEGFESLDYCNICNPCFVDCVDLINHCYIYQNVSSPKYRYVKSSTSGYYCSEENTFQSSSFVVDYLKNSHLYNLRTGITGSNDTLNRKISVNHCNNCLFDLCEIETRYYDKYVDANQNYENCVFLGVPYDEYTWGNQINSLRPVSKILPTFYEPLTYDGSNSWYVIMTNLDGSDAPKYAKKIAQSMGGNMMCIADDLEKESVREILSQFGSTYYSVNGRTLHAYTGGRITIAANGDVEYIWDDGGNYNSNLKLTGSTDEYYLYYWIGSNLSSTGYGAGTINYTRTKNNYSYDFGYILEFSKDDYSTADELMNAIDGINTNETLRNLSKPYQYHCAILNQILEIDYKRWTRFNLRDASTDFYYDLSYNYWGTQDDKLINSMIIDEYDYYELPNIDEKPILTLDDDMSEIYPFVTDIWITEHDSSNVVETCEPGQIYDVHVTYNRDMDNEIQPMITYGGEYPFTDYSVYGNWKTNREWVGTTKVSKVNTGGNYIFRAKGGSASNEPMLVCGTDINRYQFKINSSSALSMVLSATPYNDRIELLWAQNDYELLQGYNIYRATSENGQYSLLNTNGVITTNEQYYTYSDTNVVQNQKYYYYVTLVDTTGKEIANYKSNIVSTKPLDNVKPTIEHSPVVIANAGEDITIMVKVTDNVDLSKNCVTTLYYKIHGTNEWHSKNLTYYDTTGKFSDVIPKTYVTKAGIDYYIISRDTAGNIAKFQDSENPIYINTTNIPSLLMISPYSITVGTENQTVKLTGSNLSNDMILKVGTIVIDDFDVNSDGTEVTFTAPNLPMGSYLVSVIYDDTIIKLQSTNLIYNDTSSGILIPYDSVLSGKSVKLPLYLTASGEINAFYSEIILPASNLSSVNVELSEAVKALTNKPSLNINYKSGTGKLVISMASAYSFNVGTDPVVYLDLTPNAVEKETTTTISITKAQINGADIITASQNSTLTIYPNFSLKVAVNYFKGSKGIPGVKVTAGTSSSTTDANGLATLTDINIPQVIIKAKKTEYASNTNFIIGATDALLVLKYRVDPANNSLTDYQKLAADVDGNNVIDEMDAVYILKYAVGLNKSFPAGAWVFAPDYISKTLTKTLETVNFKAIMIGDVDGSYGNTN